MIEQLSKDLGINLPQDLSPAARARLKLYWHMAIIALLNALLSGVVLLNKNSVVTWNTVLTVFGGQAALALIDVLKKYVTASGDVSFSALLSLAQVSLSKNVPAVALPAPEQAIVQAATQMLNVPPVQVPFANNAVSSQAAVSLQPAPSGFIANPAPVQPVQAAPVSDHPSMDNVLTQNTLPNIVAIPK